MKKRKVYDIVSRKAIEIKGSLARHKIVKKVVNTFIQTEYRKKARGVKFRYPVETLSEGKLFIARPGHKKNFDFKVDVSGDFGLGEGSHKEIALDLRNKKRENRQKFVDLMAAITEVYDCSESEVDRALQNYHGLDKSFREGARVEVLLKVIKWLFIMEDIVYWDNEGRAFLFNFLRYVAEETDERRLKEALEKIRNPDILKTYMRKVNLEWAPSKG